MKFRPPIRKSTGHSAQLDLTSVNNHHAGVALTFSGVTNVPIDVSAINVKSLMCSESTMHLWYKYYGLFVRIYKKLFVAS